MDGTNRTTERFGGRKPGQRVGSNCSNSQFGVGVADMNDGVSSPFNINRMNNNGNLDESAIE
jgi:hypothetical protein